jgi:hypothetical protein
MACTAIDDARKLGTTRGPVFDEGGSAKFLLTDPSDMRATLHRQPELSHRGSAKGPQLWASFPLVPWH